jgi:hypothetical protein
MNINDIFEELWPDSSLEARDELLWITPFPFVNIDRVVECLTGLREKYGPNIGDAINGEMNDFDETFRVRMEQEHLQHMINLQGSHP